MSVMARGWTCPACLRSRASIIAYRRLAALRSRLVEVVPGTVKAPALAGRPAEGGRFNATALAQPERRLSRISFAAVLNHDVDGAAFAWPRIADIPDAPVLSPSGRDRQILFEITSESLSKISARRRSPVDRWRRCRRSSGTQAPRFPNAMSFILRQNCLPSSRIYPTTGSSIFHHLSLGRDLALVAVTPAPARRASPALRRSGRSPAARQRNIARPRSWASRRQCRRSAPRRCSRLRRGRRCWS